MSRGCTCHRIHTLTGHPRSGDSAGACVLTGTRWNRGQAGKENTWLKSYTAGGATVFYRVETRREREKIKKTGEVKAKGRKRAYSTGWSLLLAAWQAPLGSCSLSASSHLSSCLPLWIWCCPTSGHYLLVNACFERGGSVLNALHPLPTLLVLLLIAFHTWENRISERSTAWPNSHSY